MRRRLLVYFHGRGCLESDRCADDTLDRVAIRLEEGERVLCLRRYTYGVARRVASEEFRRQGRSLEALAQLPPAGNQPSALEERLAWLDAQLQGLPPQTAAVLLAYHRSNEHVGNDGRRRLADELGISYGALRTRIHRVRARLEARFRKIP